MMPFSISDPSAADRGTVGDKVRVRGFHGLQGQVSGRRRPSTHSRLLSIADEDSRSA
jgi:hypothetical protein